MSNISSFYDHEIQSIIALFLTNPALYKEHKSNRDRQGYFFYQFRLFANDYYHFSVDENVYFASTIKEAPGEANICGGGGSSSRFLKARHHQKQESISNQIDKFAKKYGVSFELGKDPRLFLGVREIWNKLDQANEIIAASKWANIAEISYDDASFEKPIPMKLEKHLIPFPIRNRALQKLKNMKMNAHVTTHNNTNTNQTGEEEDEEQPNAVEKPSISSNIIVLLPSASELDEDW